MLRNGCFRLIAANISTDVRDSLFKAIIYQDISFFDGSTTGELTSRLTNDSSAMVSPLNYSLTTVITSVIRFFGGLEGFFFINFMKLKNLFFLAEVFFFLIYFVYLGLVMAAYTSWKLTLLAATGVGPGVLITYTYAKWSRKINTNIWRDLGDANSTATESLSNIRTVRAFGSEEYEIGYIL